MLAAMHRSEGSSFGWVRDNYIGSTPQANASSDNWAAFWREHRLGPQLALARRNGYALDAPDVSRLLEGHRPAPSLLHGDLWGGNAGFLRNGGPVLFDPAVYCGDREADLAMTELFGGFPPEFYSAYRASAAGIRDAQAPLQSLPPAQPPEPLRRRLPGAGQGDARPSGACPLGASAARPTGTSPA